MKTIVNKNGFISTTTLFIVMISFIMLLMLTLQGFINDDKIKAIYINDIKQELNN